MSNRREHYHFIDIFRAITCYLIVLHHCLLYFPNASAAIFYTQHLKAFFPTVPLYLFISGFIHSTLYSRERPQFAPYILAKFKRILIPYLSISLITIFSRIIAEKTNLIALGERQFTNNLATGVLLRLVSAGAEGHFYFLLLLFGYLLLLPGLTRFSKTTLSATALFVSFLALDPLLLDVTTPLASTTWTPLAIVFQFASGFKFFLMGVMFARFFPYFRSQLKRNGLLVGLCAVALFTYLHHSAFQYNEYWVLIELAGYFALGVRFLDRKMKIVEQISSISFGIYLLHQPYFIKASRLILTPLALYPNSSFLTTWLLASGLTSLAVLFLQRSGRASLWILGTSTRTKPVGCVKPYAVMARTVKFPAMPRMTNPSY